MNEPSGPGLSNFDRPRVPVGGVALRIQQELLYRVADEGDATQQAFEDLRTLACADCRDPEQQGDPERGDCCVAYFNDGKLAIHFLELD